MRLEVDLLASDQPAPLPSHALGDHDQQHTVLVIAGDADVGRYLRECLRDRANLCVLEAATTSMATGLAALHPPKLLIVDAPDASVLDSLTEVRAVLIGDELTRETMPNVPVTVLARPFGARDLHVLVDRWRCSLFLDHAPSALGGYAGRVHTPW